MKRILHIPLYLITVSVLLSCQNDEPIGSPIVTFPSSLEDPERLGRTYCHVLDTMDFMLLQHCFYYYMPEMRDPNQQYWNSVDSIAEHEPLNYGNLCLLLSQEPVSELDADEMQKDHVARSKFRELTKEASDKLTLTADEKIATDNPDLNTREFEHYLYYNKTSLCGFNLARHTGQFSIVADKTLFGKSAGTNLSEHFLVKSENKCLPKGTLQNFTHVFWYDQEDTAMIARDFFAKDTWLQRNVLLCFKDVPKEQYDYINFEIRMPLTCEYWMRYYREYLDQIPVEEKELVYRCVVPFGKMSTFKEDFRNIYAVNPGVQWADCINMSSDKKWRQWSAMVRGM